MGGRCAGPADRQAVTPLRRALRHAGPATGFPGWIEAIRAGIGPLLALALLELALRPVADPGTGLFVIAPFGATAVLLYAMPNSPLAQPWSALVGNGVSALVGVACVLWVEDPALRVALAAGLAVFAMHLARALHPPGGAVAVTAALSPDLVQAMGFWFVLAPVVLGTGAMIAIAALYARLTGRRYPFRQPAEVNAQGTTDPAPLDRLSVSRDDLARILHDYRQSANIGVEDLARLIAAAETEAIRSRAAGLTCADIMSRDLVTVRPEAPLAEVAAIFRDHGFTSLPVEEDGRYLGVIFQIHLIRRMASLQPAPPPGLGGTLRPPVASDLMDHTLPHVTPETPVSALMPLLANGPVDAAPVLDGDRLNGIVTRTDLIATLARLQSAV